jgi:hypothetical protein
MRQEIVMAEQMNGALFRQVAQAIEQRALTDLNNTGDVEAAPVIGDMQYFPRATPEARAAQSGFRLLRERTDDAVAMLYALAEAADRNVPLADSPLLVLVKPYIDLHQLQRQRPDKGGDRDRRQGADKE